MSGAQKVYKAYCHYRGAGGCVPVFERAAKQDVSELSITAENDTPENVFSVAQRINEEGGIAVVY